MSDREDCSHVIQSWAYFRDQGRWEELLGTFHPEGQITVTWFKGSFVDFVEASRKSFKPLAPRAKHLMAPSLVEVRGDRAVGETSSTIWGTTEIGGLTCEGMTQARFLDRLECREARWRIVERVAIYERDVIFPQGPSHAFEDYMRSEALQKYPAPYRYLADRLVRRGQHIVSPLPCDGDELSGSLLQQAKDWLGAA